MERFTKYKTMVFPREVIVGHNTTDQIKDLCKRITSRQNVVIVSDKNTKRISGDRIEKILSGSGFEVNQISLSLPMVKKDIPVAWPSMKEVQEVMKYVVKHDPNFLIGVGGGSIIDVTKVTSFELQKQYISVPTSAAHDGMASPRASLKDRHGSISKTAVSPMAVLADTTIISKAPYRMLASGCADVASNLSAVLDWELAHRLKNEEFSTFAASLSETSSRLLLEKAEDIRSGLEEAVWQAVKCMIVSGVAMSVAGTTRPASGAEHMFSHMLDRIMPGKALHGEQCGVGAIMMMYLHGGDWEQIRDFLKTIGAPTSARELRIPHKKIIEALLGAQTIRPERYTILGEQGLTKDAAKKIAKITHVI
ncbi:MAG: NAD(P)-dependent glycerol-1-phosphate dehydrogenase [Candidatus Thermoplasmatota archaeon]|nr:NAD(P)-dependent glycerol-1-phosphate dehydrogenase [Candidatus Thermoplasmatota archaeon]